jgi:apolipoprotein D and lipocalin family protein
MRSTLMGLLVLAVGCTRLPPPPTVDELDLSRYAGRWYEIASLPRWFQRGCRGTEAEYRLREDQTIEVINSCWRGEPERYDQAHATAWRPDPKFPGRLKVQFFWPFAADYWVFQLDPTYQWALVGSPDRSGLWILSRQPTLDDPIVNRLTQWAHEQGFDTDAMRPTLPH